MTVSGLATDIYTNIGSPTDLTEAAIQYWLRTNVDSLNAKTFSSYVLSSGTSGEIVDSAGNISGCQMAVYKKMYEVYRWDTVIRTKLTALDSDSLLEVSDDGGTVRRVNKNEVIKTIKDLRSQDLQDLNFLIEDCNSLRGCPSAVHGDDTIAGLYPEVSTVSIRYN